MIAVVVFQGLAGFYLWPFSLGSFALPGGYHVLFAAFWALFGLELLWLLTRMVWAGRLVALQGPARPTRALTYDEMAAGVRALRVVALVAATLFVLVAGLFLVASVLPGTGNSFAVAGQAGLILGGSVTIVTALIGLRDMVRVRGRVWRIVGIALMLLALVLDVPLVSLLFATPINLNQIDPVWALMPIIVPLLALAYAVYTIRQRPFSQSASGEDERQ